MPYHGYNFYAIIIPYGATTSSPNAVFFATPSDYGRTGTYTFRIEKKLSETGPTLIEACDLGMSFDPNIDINPLTKRGLSQGAHWFNAVEASYLELSALAILEPELLTGRWLNEAERKPAFVFGDVVK